MVIDTKMMNQCIANFEAETTASYPHQQLLHHQNVRFRVIGSHKLSDSEPVDLLYEMVEEVLFTATLMAASIKPLFAMSAKANVLSEEMLDVMSKYFVLGLLSILSSLAASVITIFYISTESLFVIWTKALLESADCVINSWCTVLLFPFVVSWYGALCGPCNRAAKAMYIRQLDKQSMAANTEMARK